jgi:hypothetical protein
MGCLLRAVPADHVRVPVEGGAVTCVKLCRVAATAIVITWRLCFVAPRPYFIQLAYLSH